MIENLQFFKDREALAGPDGYQVNRARAKDRTVSVVRKWMATNDALKKARSETMQTLEAVPGKGNTVSLVVMDRERFDGLQEAIKAHSGQLKALEDVIRKLDEIAAGGELWFQDIEDGCGSYGRTEFGENQRLSNLASATLARRMNSGVPADEILKADAEYQRFKGIASEQISNANKQLAQLRPKLAEMKQLLEAVGC